MIYRPGATRADVENQDAFETGWNVAERLILGAIVVAVVAGLLGVWGSGWLSGAVARSGDVALTYPRVLRRTAPAVFVLDVVAAGRTLDVRVSQGQAGQVRATQPRALATTAGQAGTTYTFATSPGEGAHLVFELQPSRVGLLRSTVVVEGQTLTITQLLLP